MEIKIYLRLNNMINICVIFVFLNWTIKKKCFGLQMVINVTELKQVAYMNSVSGKS